MKTSLKLLVLVLAAGFPAVAFAEMLGAHVPSSLGAEPMIGVLTAVSLGLLLAADYAPRSSLRSYAKAPVATRKSSVEAHRLAA